MPDSNTANTVQVTNSVSSGTVNFNGFPVPDNASVQIDESALQNVFSVMSDTSQNDISIQALRSIFGSVVDNIIGTSSVISTTNGSIINLIFMYFNTALFFFIAMIVFWMALIGSINTARDGEFLGNTARGGYSTFWSFLKPVASSFFVLPLAKLGYLNLIQYIMLWSIIASIGFTNKMYNGMLDYYKEYNGLTTVNSSNINNNFVKNYAFSYLCMKANNDRTISWNEKVYKSEGSFSQDDKDYYYVAFDTQKIVGNQSSSASSSSNSSSSSSGKDILSSIYNASCGYVLISCPKNPEDKGLLESAWDKIKGFLGAGMEYGEELEKMKYASCIVQKDAYWSMLGEIETGIENFYTIKAGPTPISKVNALKIRINNAGVKFKNTYSQGLKSSVFNSSSSATSLRDKLVEQAKDMGWMMSGAWYAILSMETYRMNTVLKGGMNISTAGPQSKFFNGTFNERLIEMYHRLNTALNFSQNSSIKVKVNLGEGVSQSYTVDLNVKASKTSAPTVDILGNTSDARDKAQEVIAQMFGDKITESMAIADYALGLFEGDPIRSLSSWGHKMIDTAVVLWAASIATSGVSKLASDEDDDGSDSGKGGSSIAGAFKDVAGGVAKKLLGSISGMLSEVGTVLFIMGALLAYYLPIIPFIYWMFGILGWFIMVVESMIAAPLWGLAHAIPENVEGWFGRHNQLGYQLFISVTLRPVIMFMGLVLTIFVFYFLVRVTIFGFSLANQSIVSGSNSFDFLSWLISSFILIIVIILIGVKTQEAIYRTADNVIRWIGFGVSPLGEVSGINQEVKAGVEKSVSSVQRTMTGAVTGLTSAPGTNKGPSGVPGGGGGGNPVTPGGSSGGGRTFNTAKDGDLSSFQSTGTGKTSAAQNANKGGTFSTAKDGDLSSFRNAGYSSGSYGSKSRGNHNNGNGRTFSASKDDDLPL